MADYSTADLERDYYLGNYQTCISKANSMPMSRASIYYMCLSYIHLRKTDSAQRELSKVNIDELAEEDDEGFGATFIDVIKAYLQGLDDNKHKSVEAIDQLESSKKMKPDDELSRITASAVYASHRLYPKALQVIDRLDSLRVSYAKIIVYIMMNRGDLAEKQAEKMQKVDEQNPMTELAFSQVLLANRNPTQSWRIALSLADRYKPTPLLNNLLTAAAVCLGDYDQAKQFCEGSLDMDNDNPEALINMVHILSKLKSSQQVLERNIERLKDLYPSHDFVRELASIPIELESSCD